MYRRSSQLLSEPSWITTLDNRARCNRRRIQSLVTLKFISKPKNWSPHSSTACVQVPRNSQPTLFGL